MRWCSNYAAHARPANQEFFGSGGDSAMSRRTLLVATTEYPPFKGGIGTYAREMARAAAMLGWSPVVWAPNYGSNQIESTAGGVRIERYEGGVPSRSSLPRLMMQFSMTCGRHRPHTVLLCSWPDALCASALRLYTFCRCVLMCHGTELLNLPYGRISKLLGYRRLVERAQVIACNSQYTASLLAKAGLKPGGCLRVTPLAASDFWGEAVDPNDARRMWNIPDADIVLSTVGRMDDRKGQDLVIRALALLPKELQRRVTYLVVGPEVDPDYAKELRGLADRSMATVLFTGGISDEGVRAVYAASDLFVLTGKENPHRVEGFGLVLLEAASQGVPSLVTRVGGVPEVVVDGRSGVILESWDPQAIAAAIEGLLRDKQRLATMGALARERASTFSWSSTAEMTLA